MFPRMRGLYAICDVDFLLARGVEPLDFADAVLQCPPAAVQLRAKSLPARETVELLRALRARCERLGVPIFANDRPDLALIAGCSGVHLGQTDLDIADARRVAPGLAIGVSTHDLSQLEIALRERPAYVAFGPVFATLSKANPDPVVGLEGLAAASQRCRVAGVPLVAIGGLRLERAAEVARHADAGAVISALLPAAGIPGAAAVARELHRALGGLNASMITDGAGGA